jgi:hypothetical protein
MTGILVYSMLFRDLSVQLARTQFFSGTVYFMARSLSIQARSMGTVKALLKLIAFATPFQSAPLQLPPLDVFPLHIKYAVHILYMSSFHAHLYSNGLEK